MRFHASRALTLGVELELQTVDRTSLDLAQKAPDILATVPPRLRDRIKPEFIRSMVELNTEICDTVAQVEENLKEIYREAEKAAMAQECILFASSLHPLAQSKDQLLTDDSRYHRIMDDLQLVGRRFIAQGLHVHVGMPDGESCIRVCDSMRLYLPLLLALTTSSPYYEGIDTGLYSYRAKLFEALPLAGIPDRLGDWSHFNSVVLLLMKHKIINSVRDLWWDIRPHPDFGTVEVRICDLPSRFDEILAVVALIQCLAAHLLERNESLYLNMQILRSNKWQAARYGLDGAFVDPCATGTTTIRDAVPFLLQQIAPCSSAYDNKDYLAPIQRILASGTSSTRQREIVANTGDLRRILSQMAPTFFS